MSISSCCVKGFEWAGAPSGRVGKLGSNNAYIVGSNKSVAILIIPDLFGWDFINVRLLADHYAREVDGTVFVPDFFAGDGLPLDLLFAERYNEIDLDGFISRHSRAIREPDIVACAKALKNDLKFESVSAVGFCYGAWAAFRLGALDLTGNLRANGSAEKPLVDCITVGHPSMLTTYDIDKISVPVQVLAPEHDFAYTPDLKLYTFQKLQARGVIFDYQHFPGVYHACLVRGNEKKQGEREAMLRGKNAAVAWMRQWLHSADTTESTS